MTPPQTAAIVLRNHAISLDSEIGKVFISDCARHTEGLLSEGDIKSKWDLSDDAWHSLEHNGALLEAVRRERECRARNGAATAEAASLEFAKAPSVLGGLLTNQEVSPRHRIEAARELRAIVSADRDGAVQLGETFTVVINLGADGKRIYRLQQPVLDLREDDA